MRERGSEGMGGSRDERLGDTGSAGGDLDKGPGDASGLRGAGGLRGRHGDGGDIGDPTDVGSDFGNDTGGLGGGGGSLADNAGQADIRGADGGTREGGASGGI
jgi:hypothetical protein